MASGDGDNNIVANSSLEEDEEEEVSFEEMKSRRFVQVNRIRKVIK